MTADQRIRVVYIVGTLDVGGTEKQMAETAIRLDREHFLPHIYCFSKGGALVPYLEQHGIHVTLFHEEILEEMSFGHRMKRYVRKFLHLFQYIRKMRPDIVHCYLYSPTVFGGLTARLACVPVLITSRRCLGLFKDGHTNYQRLENFVNRMTDAVLVNSEALRTDVLQREAIPAEKVHVIHNGIDIQTYQSVPAGKAASLSHFRQQFNIPPDAQVVGILANLISYKGHRDLLLAAARVLQRVPETRFICMGEDRGIRAQLEQLSCQLGIADRIIFTGYISVVTDILTILDIQVSASHEEGFSNAILEGMAAGKPVIATAVGGTPEAVIHDETGLLVPPHSPDALAQALVRLLTDHDFAAQLGRNGRIRVENYFSMEKMIDKFENVYLNLWERTRIRDKKRWNETS